MSYTDVSMQWKQQCEPIRQIAQLLDLKSFGVDKMERDISTQFKVVQYMTQTQKHLKKLYVNPEHFIYNRHNNIMTFDQNRVFLAEGDLKESPDHYINANFIDVCQHKVIATQGPLHSTINSFWRMINKQKVAAIFMLCQRVQKQKVKCDLYWPTSQEQNLEAGDFQVKLIQKQNDGKYIKFRKFSIKNKLTEEEKEVEHFQFVGWPDGDKPLEQSQNSLNKLLKKMLKFIENDEMVVVHCSAGVGRTGTLIAMAEIKLLIPKIESISIFEIVRKLRQQRWAMVYTATQYEYLYQFTESESIKFFQPKSEDSFDENEEVASESNAESSQQLN